MDDVPSNRPAPVTAPVTAPATGAPADPVDLAYGRDRAERATDALATLHTRIVDALAGFETMVDKAEPAFRPVAERFRTLHAHHAERIALMLSDAGRAPDDSGSFMSTLNRTVVSLRAFFDEIDEDVMESIRDGEKHVLDAFGEAIAAVPAPRAEALSVLQAELSALLAETRHLD